MGQVRQPQKVFVGKLVNLPVFDPLGDPVGKVRDVVVVHRTSKRPRVVGLVVEVPGKRQVFMPMTRVTSLDAGQLITTGLVNMRRFEKRTLETLVMSEIVDRHVRLTQPAAADGLGAPATVEDVAMRQTRTGDWEVAQVFVRAGHTRRGLTGRLRRSGETHLVAVDDVQGLTSPLTAQNTAELLASLDGMKAADIAEQLKNLPEDRRRAVAAELSDEQLADVVEELGDDDQVSLIGSLGEHRAADVLEAMQPDDAADLLSELPSAQQEHFLLLMEPDDADSVRRLMAYDDYTAGGLMTTVPVILSPESTVAEGLALVRRAELSPTVAAAVFVCRPPLETPTGRFLGVAHIQAMLRHAPHEPVGAVMDSDAQALAGSAPLSSVTRLMATYNLVSVPVTDAEGHLLGVVTVDDVLDHLLPDDWRDTAEVPSDPVTGEFSLRSLGTATSAPPDGATASAPSSTDHAGGTTP